MTGQEAGDGKPEERDGFRFRGGHVALDLTATLRGRLREHPQELLATEQDLDRWLRAAGLAAGPSGATSADVSLARELREAVYTLAQPGSPEAAERQAALQTLNRISAGPAAAPMLSPSGGFELRGGSRDLLGSVAREAVLLLGGASADRVKQCQSPTCTLLFLDTSRSGRRRWCSMEACGNQAKVRAFRNRRPSAGASQKA
jgi:predicted RNA-binding Zn ribbon-like protein